MMCTWCFFRIENHLVTLHLKTMHPKFMAWNLSPNPFCRPSKNILVMSYLYLTQLCTFYAFVFHAHGTLCHHNNLWLYIFAMFETQSKSCRSSCIESQVINMKLKKNQEKVPGPPPKFSASDRRICGKFQHCTFLCHYWFRQLCLCLSIACLECEQ